MILDSTEYYLSAGGGANYVMNQASFPVISDKPDCNCGNFSGGNIFSGYFALGGGYFLLDNLAIDARLLFDSRPAFLSEKTSAYEVLNSNQEYVTLDLDHTFESSLVYSSVQLGAFYYPFANYSFAIGLAADWSAPLLNSEYEQQDEIRAPQNVSFDGSRTRIAGSGNYDEGTDSYGVTGLLRYDFGLDKNITVSPELAFRYGLNSITSSGEWMQNIVRAGVSISFNMKYYEKVYGRVSNDPGSQNRKPNNPQLAETVIPEKVENEKLEVKEPVIVKETSKSSIADIVLDPLIIKETIVSQTFPLLPYIFFEEGSSDLDRRYMSERDNSNFSEKNLPKNTLDIYYSTLDILAKRLSINPSANVTVTGYHNSRETETYDTDSKTLALNRAESIKKYLLTKGSINPDQISIQGGEKPPIATSTEYEEGYEENSRAEIAVSNPELLKPIEFKDFLEYSNSKPAVTGQIFSNSEGLIDIEFRNGNEILKKQTLSKEELLTEGIKYDNELLQKLFQAKENGSEVNIAAKLKGEETEYSESLDISPLENDFEVGRINLIVFDFDKSELGEVNKKMLDVFLGKEDFTTSRFLVQGSTDRLGEARYNTNLSQERAEKTTQYIRNLNPTIKNVKTVGLGSSVLDFDNSLPEGRFYCRTVLIETETPVK
ncbi:MAG: hypothetical protein Kapaf2KO_04100 [Candidatus Kapaibacteriales bacterium]